MYLSKIKIKQSFFALTTSADAPNDHPSHSYLGSPSSEHILSVSVASAFSKSPKQTHSSKNSSKSFNPFSDDNSKPKKVTRTLSKVPRNVQTVANITRRISTVVPNFNFKKDHVFYVVKVTGKRGDYEVLKQAKDFRELHTNLLRNFPALKKLIPQFPLYKLRRTLSVEEMENRRQFFNTYLDALFSLQPAPELLFQFVDVDEHRAELRSSLEEDAKVKLEDFQLLKRIGEGSFGKVFLVKAFDSDKVHAMKVLSKSELRKKRQIEHTRTELRVMAQSHSPFIVKLVHAFQTPHRLFMVTQYCPGGELFFHLKNRKVLDSYTTAFLGAEIALALKYLHSNDILYRDLKPENVLVNSGGHVLLTDFGLARMEVVDDFSAKTFCGTPEYLSPEMIFSKDTHEGYGKPVDWWALGILVYEMKFGIPPFYHRDVKRMVSRILNDPLQFPSKKYKNLYDGLTNGFEYDNAEQAIELNKKDETLMRIGLKSVLKNLLKREPRERFRFEDLREAPFFCMIDWEKMEKMEVESPFELTVSKDPLNTDHFDPEFTDKPARLSVGRATLMQSREEEEEDEYELKKVTQELEEKQKKGLMDEFFD